MVHRAHDHRLRSLKEFVFGCTLCAALLAFIFTVYNLCGWIVESEGAWARGQIIAIHTCVGRGQHGMTELDVSYTDSAGQQHIGGTGCHIRSNSIGQTITIRYLALFPWRVLTRDDIGSGFGRPLLLSLATGILTIPLTAYWIIGIKQEVDREFVTQYGELRPRNPQTPHQNANPPIPHAVRAQRRRSHRRR